MLVEAAENRMPNLRQAKSQSMGLFTNMLLHHFFQGLDIEWFG